MTSPDRRVGSVSTGGAKPLHLFIDANIFLKFYDFATEDLNELLKLRDRIRDGHVVLYVTSQVLDEVQRNRERKVATSFLRLLKDTVPDEYPNYAKYEETLYREVLSAQRRLQEERQKLIEKIRERIRERKLRADEVLRELFLAARRGDHDPRVIERAKLRVALGNPPGKRGSIGDAVSWEALLEDVPDGEILILVSGDADFQSQFDKGRIREFLVDEWKDKKSGDLVLFPSLLEFAKEHEKTMQLRMETMRVEDQSRFVERLEGSDNFESTHAAIGALEKCSPFTVDNVRRLVDALRENSQVWWISEDQDVSAFYRRLYREQSNDMSEAMRRILYSRYSQLKQHAAGDDVDVDDVPF